MDVFTGRRSAVALAVLMLAASLVAVRGADARPLGVGWRPNDPFFEHQWALRQIRAPEAWARSRGNDVVIAVIDMGVDLQHEDLKENLVPGRTFVHCPDPQDPNGCLDGDYRSGTPWFHGTASAGVAAAVANNGVGISGVAPKAKLMPIKTNDPGGYTAVNFAQGIRWAADNGAQVITSSVGIETIDGSFSDFELISRAIDYAIKEKGAVFVQAAGNKASPTCVATGGDVYRPLGDAKVLCVVATDRRELRSAYSSGAIKRDQLAVAAPGGSNTLPTVCGENVLTTWPSEFGDFPTTQSCPGAGNPHYEEGSGTSIAAPQVAGVAALLIAMRCSGEESVSLITSTARNPLTGATGEWDPVYGYGIVDADAATAAALEQCRGSR